MKKYEFTGDVKIHFGVKLQRIRALTAFDTVAAGTIGGWIECEKNLSQVYGNAWVSDDAWVYGNAQVYGDAWVYGTARVHGDARVYGNARVSDDARVYGTARVHGDALVYGDARVHGDAWVYGDAQVYGTARVHGDALVLEVALVASRSDGYLFVCHRQKTGPVIVSADCRYFTFVEARKHWTKTRAGTSLGDETFAILDFFEAAAKARRWM